MLSKYDLVFAHGRCAHEALAVGCAVVLCSQVNSGPMVTAKDVDLFGRSNFGIRLLPHAHSKRRFNYVIGTYDAEDASDTCDRVHEKAKSNHWLPQLVGFYEAAIQEYKSSQGFWTTQAKLKEATRMAAFMSAWSKEVDLVGVPCRQRSDEVDDPTPGQPIAEQEDHS